VLVNNAANDVRHEVETLTVERWDELSHVNVRHHFFATQAVVPMMRAAGGGSIVNLGSIAVHIDLPDPPTYITAKAGIEGLTRTLAQELGPDGIRVNCVVPGWVMTEKQLRDEVLTLLIAGHETTANLLAWALFLLAQDEAADARLHAEARALLDGRGGFTSADADRMSYARQVIQEALRLYPPGWFVGRAALSDVRLGAYTVPRGAVVMLSQYVMHRDARFFPQPERFRPDRWAGDFLERLPRGAYFPFSAGDRHCIGEGFAWQEALLILATLVERWRFELVPGQSIHPRPSVTLRPDGPIKMIVRPRK